ncbi:hypothetical protein GPALN_010185 [Globodera pallida]|nr:hypothetical protein GPALN_010185 [Globodera pallida]
MKVKTIVVALALFGQFFVNANVNHSIVQYEQPAGGLIKTITGQIEPMDSSNVQIEKYVTIMPQNVPALIQHTLLINVYEVCGHQSVASRFRNFIVSFRTQHSNKFNQRMLARVQNDFRQKKLKKYAEKLPEAIEYANSIIITYKTVINNVTINGEQSPLDLEIEICKETSQKKAQILLHIKEDFEFKVEVEQFLNALNAHGVFLREKNVALVEIGQKIMQLHILVLYSMFYSEFLKALQELNSSELNTYRFEHKWLKKMLIYFAARYAKMKPNCLEYDKKPHGILEDVDKFISEEVQPHLAKCDKLMQQFADQHQLLASEEEKPSEIQQMILY